MNAVVFDCDGVLVDSEQLAWDAWREILSRFGIELTDADIGALTGRAEREAYEHFVARNDLPPYEDFSKELAAALSQRFASHLEAFEDAIATLEGLSELDVPLAVASSSSRARLDAALTRTGLADRFSASVAGDEVEQGKPAPDLYLAAAEALGVSPSACVAVEDSPAGVQAARAAGMRVVAVARGQYTEDELSAADAVVDRLTAGVLVEGEDL